MLYYSQIERHCINVGFDRSKIGYQCLSVEERCFRSILKRTGPLDLLNPTDVEKAAQSSTVVSFFCSGLS